MAHCDFEDMHTDIITLDDDYCPGSPSPETENNNTVDEEMNHDDDVSVVTKTVEEARIASDTEIADEVSTQVITDDVIDLEADCSPSPIRYRNRPVKRMTPWCNRNLKSFTEVLGTGLDRLIANGNADYANGQDKAEPTVAESFAEGKAEYSSHQAKQAEYSVVELEDEDDLHHPIYRSAVEMEDYKCFCEETFGSKAHFITHHRRHVTYGLYRCPREDCLRGFTTLQECTYHEKVKHGISNARNTRSNGIQPKPVIASSTLLLSSFSRYYRNGHFVDGENVKDIEEHFEIGPFEHEHGVKEIFGVSKDRRSVEEIIDTETGYSH